MQTTEIYLDSKDNNVQETSFSLPVRALAGFISYVFHPLFLPLYVILFLLFVHPDAFTGFSPAARWQIFFIVFINIVLFPLLSVLLLKALGFIDSIFLRERKDRIIPYIACGIFFFWAYNVFKQQPQYPLLWVSFLLGLFLSSSAALIANIYFKVSMHAIGVGGVAGFFLMLTNSNQMPMPWPLALSILIAGFVCTSRLLLKAHRPFDIYGGLVIGFVLQFAAFIITC
mgnify:CR=1 FL=1